MTRLLLLITLLIVNVDHVSAQQIDPGDVIRVTTTLVTVPVRVMDHTGKYVPDMREEEFRVFEDGVEQRLAYFAPVATPFTIILMLDISESTHSTLKEIKDAALNFISQLRPDDEVIIITFDNRVNAIDQPTTDRDALRRMIEGIQPGGGTRLFDALDLVFKRLLHQIKRRKAIVLFTDGVDVESRKTAGEIMQAAEELDTLIYSARYDTYDAIREKIRRANNSSPSTLPTVTSTKGTAEDYRMARLFLKSLAEKTGGNMYEGRDPQKLEKAFAMIAEELRWQYSLGYYPTAPPIPGQQRRIRVVMNRPRVVVHARSRYTHKR